MEKQPKRFPDADPSLAYDVAKRRLDIQLASIDALDNKLAVGLSLGTALMTVLLAFLGLSVSLKDDSEILSTPSIVLLSLTGAAYIASAYFFVQAFLVRSWSIGPSTRDVWEIAETYREHMWLLYWAVVERLDDSYDENVPQYAQKLRQGAWGFALLAAQLLSGAALVIQTF